MSILAFFAVCIIVGGAWGFFQGFVEDREHWLTIWREVRNAPYWPFTRGKGV